MLSQKSYSQRKSKYWILKENEKLTIFADAGFNQARRVSEAQVNNSYILPASWWFIGNMICVCKLWSDNDCVATEMNKWLNGYCQSMYVEFSLLMFKYSFQTSISICSSIRLDTDYNANDCNGGRCWKYSLFKQVVDGVCISRV